MWPSLDVDNQMMMILKRQERLGPNLIKVWPHYLIEMRPTLLRLAAPKLASLIYIYGCIILK